MDFVRELDSVENFLQTHQFRYAVIGGVAIAAYGNPRLTLDLDVATDASAQGLVVPFMESEGFLTLHHSPGYSNHRHKDGRRGRVDFMYLRDSTADRVFGSLRELRGPRDRPILVPRPEHLIAMKVQAMKDAPERALQDFVDCAFLVQVDGVDRDEVRGYFVRAGLEEKWNELTRSI